MRKFFKEFKEFAMRGNVMDMAVGIILGGAFGKIVTSLVSDIVMPAVGILIGGVNFTDLKIVLKSAYLDTTGKEIPAVTINYGNFIEILIDFVIVAFAIFIAIRAINKLSFLRKHEETPTPASEPQVTKEEQLLTEIRDLLKNK
ncbi:MAG: large-conductance mechanosensitive channel protein MscL [Bacteroidales bacterium]